MVPGRVIWAWMLSVLLTFTHRGWGWCGTNVFIRLNYISAGYRHSITHLLIILCMHIFIHCVVPAWFTGEFFFFFGLLFVCVWVSRLSSITKILSSVGCSEGDKSFIWNRGLKVLSEWATDVIQSVLHSSYNGCFCLVATNIGFQWKSGNLAEDEIWDGNF